MNYPAWQIKSTEPAAEEALAGAGCGTLLRRVLAARGCTDPAEVQALLGAGAELSDPFLLRDMDKAVARIEQAVENEETIVIYGDYDVDGISATAILYECLSSMGAHVRCKLPTRGTGYGLTRPALESLAEKGFTLVVTVDNGISAIEEAACAKELGLDLIVTDHHLPGETLPDAIAVVDPKRADDESPFKDLCGAGVVLKLLCALEEDEDFVMEQYSDLAAVGTVGDVMPLIGENRYIVRRGLENIQSCQNLGLERLLRSAGTAPEQADAATLAYTVCPRLNAAGRIAGADKAVQLLLTDSPERASLLSEELTVLNNKRREEETKILEGVERQLAGDPARLKERVLVVYGEGWHHGVIGIIAAKLLEKYGKPVLIMGIENGEARGSARGIDGFSIYKLLERCSLVLTKFGGHLKAGGFSLPADKVEDFRQMVYAFCRECYPKMPEYSVSADMEVTGAQLTQEQVAELSKLEPCGEGNRRPVFLLKNCTVLSKRALKEGRYTSLELQNGGVKLKALCFGIPFSKCFAEIGSAVDIIASAEVNEFRDEKSVALKVQELRPAGFREDRFFAAQRTYEAISRGEGCDQRLAPRVIPDREALKSVYDLLRKHGGMMSAEEMYLYGGGELNYCMLRIALDVFSAAGMAEFSADAGTVRLIPVKQKIDLMSVGLLAELRRSLSVE